MLILQADVLNSADLRAARGVLAAAPFRNGWNTAGAKAERVKDNEQARGDDPQVITLARRIRLALEGHPVVRTWCRPARWSHLMFSRYSQDQHYGLHTDNAIMYDGEGWPLRTDISFTLFLSDPASYEGGALLIQEASGPLEFRPAAGSAIFYPTGELHAVTQVTRGTRLACVGWIQSLIRRPDQRALLHDLEKLRSGSSLDDPGLLLDKTIGNLLRMWSED